MSDPRGIPQFMQDERMKNVANWVANTGPYDQYGDMMNANPCGPGPSDGYDSCGGGPSGGCDPCADGLCPQCEAELAALRALQEISFTGQDPCSGPVLDPCSGPAIDPCSGADTDPCSGADTDPCSDPCSQMADYVASMPLPQVPYPCCPPQAQEDNWLDNVLNAVEQIPEPCPCPEIGMEVPKEKVPHPGLYICAKPGTAEWMEELVNAVQNQIPEPCPCPPLPPIGGDLNISDECKPCGIPQSPYSDSRNKETSKFFPPTAGLVSDGIGGPKIRATPLLDRGKPTMDGAGGRKIRSSHDD